MYSREWLRRVSVFFFILLISMLSAGIGVFRFTSSVEAASWPTEEEGSTGENVVSIQLFLLADGYLVSADGDFGPHRRMNLLLLRPILIAMATRLAMSWPGSMHWPVVVSMLIRMK